MFTWPEQVLEKRCLGSLKEQPETELRARTAEQGLVSARTYQRLGADRQVPAFARLG